MNDFRLPERESVHVLTTPEDVERYKAAAAKHYAAMWKAKFGFPVPQDLLDRWWPMTEMKDD
jgi:hypothetical protein